MANDEEQSENALKDAKDSEDVKIENNDRKKGLFDFRTENVVRITDLIRSNSPKKSSDKKSLKTSNSHVISNSSKSKRIKNVENEVILETSSFKMSNRLAVHGNKPKKNKQSLNSSTDVTWLHDQKMKYFIHLQEEILPQKRKELEICKDEVRRFELSEDIYKIEQREEEMDYLLTTHKIVDKYTNVMENDDQSLLKRDTVGSINKFITKYDNVEKDKITEEYCQALNNGLMISCKKLKFDDSICANCGSDTHNNEGFVSCDSCGETSEMSIPDFRLSYSDYQDTVVRSTFAYKRVNRFREILATMQGKENTQIPQGVLEAVQQEINKEINPDLNSISTAKIKYYLKRLSLTSYYDHAPHILNMVNGIPPIEIPSSVEEKLLEMFTDIQEPFDRLKTEIIPTRLSFLNYNFCLYKMTELLDLDEFKKYFTLLKSVEKLRLQDKIWKGICAELKWQFIPSI